MKRWWLFFTVGAVLLGCSPKKTEIVIGISKIVAHPALDAVEQGIKDELTEQNLPVTFDVQNANGDLNTAAAIANKFKSDKVALAVGIATPTAQALVNTLKTTPVVFSAVTDPVKAGLVTSLARGEKNVCGVSDMTPVKEQIQFFRKLKPIKRLGIIYTSSEANAVALADLTKAVCKELGIEVVETTVANSAEVKQAAQAIVDKVDGIYISTDNTVVSALSSVTSVAMAKKVPVMTADPTSATNADVLVAWGFDYYKMGRATGRMIADVLRGQKPSEIPVKFMTDPQDITLFINEDIAKQLGIQIPTEIISQASILVQNGKVITK
ncbi:ABC transporter substrate-binding protein [Thermospira aquatica]|uniref:ABC transporter substrate-binding protein n=1 Tax=Thermospira aquatica TaxID=2828656 RepID=A0AAX3BFB4_9SPIR|nr:ABC transporter substrate-binding protein [Thermospira aquatica]URA10967.1 ABC transporter substrate-binding protein [Thermospira aquatica]